MSHQVWAALHDLAQTLDSDVPTRRRLKGLLKELEAQPRPTHDLTLQEAEYVYLSLGELLHLARQRSPADED